MAVNRHTSPLVLEYLYLSCLLTPASSLREISKFPLKKITKSTHSHAHCHTLQPDPHFSPARPPLFSSIATRALHAQPPNYCQSLDFTCIQGFLILIYSILAYLFRKVPEFAAEYRILQYALCHLQSLSFTIHFILCFCSPPECNRFLWNTRYYPPWILLVALS